MTELTLTQHMLSRFTTLAEKYSSTEIARSGWSSRHTQEARFRVMREVLRDDWSVLDVGCGTGDFFQYLIQSNFRGQYTGIDLIESNIEEAGLRFGKNRFVIADIHRYEPSTSFDFIIASGLFFLKASDWDESVQNCFTKMQALTRYGFAANFLSIHSSERKEFLQYACPADLLKRTAEFSNKYVLKHDYAKSNNDFTIFIFK